MKKRTVLLSLILLLLLLATAVSGCSSTTGEALNETASNGQKIVNITAAEALALIQANTGNPDFIIIDVRTPEEYAAGHIESAVLVNYNSADFQEEISKFNKEKTYLIYCRTGNRSSGARDIMKELGFREIYHMDGGITEWQAQGFPVVK
ncbi:MAG: sulfurtransferase [Chloroflexi bacterium RBG_16_50_11]|nr:MAG: sulfurtransferase [Chloroflexi bacterium RBG_16_50_11]